MDVMGRKEGDANKANRVPKTNNGTANKRNSAAILSDENLVQSPAPTDRRPLSQVINGTSSGSNTPASPATVNQNAKIEQALPSSQEPSIPQSTSNDPSTSSSTGSEYHDAPEQQSSTGADAIFKPRIPIVLDTNDVNLDVERRTKGAYTWAVTTSVAHVWFNTFFEGNGPEQNGSADVDGVFEIEWDKMDGIKGSSRKGTRAFDKVSVLWKAVETRGEIREPRPGEGVKQKEPADWRQQDAKGVESSDEEGEGIKSHHVRE